MKIKHFVRQSLFFSLFFGGMSFPILQVHANGLPDIEAHLFKVVPLEKSRTGRVYRFKADTEQLPKVGNILLIEENDKPIMAFRVLKNDSSANEFVAKRVRRYDTTSELVINQKYSGAEKVADLVNPPLAETQTPEPKSAPIIETAPVATQAAPVAVAPVAPSKAKPDSDLDAGPAAPPPAATPELEPPKALNVNQYDDDLDSSTSPMNLKEDDGVADVGDIDRDLEVKERNIINPFRNMIGVSVGTYKNISNLVFSNPPAGGFTAYYSNVVKRNVIFKKEMPQDSVSLEYAFEYYSRINVAGHNDDYTFLPLRVDLRYDMHLSEIFTPFVYIGAQYNLILATTNTDRTNNPIDANNFSSLGAFQPNFGVGLFYTMGPQWYLRADLGIDRIALGLAVRW